MDGLDKKSVEFRRQILDVIERSRRGHIGSAFSIVEILRVLYENVLNVNPRNPRWEERDRFILSKGHGCLALYIALAQKGFFDAQSVLSFCQFDSPFGGHPQYGKVPGVEASTGSLGHGLSIGVGVALNGKIEKKNYQTIVLVGDGECDEGEVWEAALCAAQHQLSRLTVLVDYNKTQCYGRTCDILDLEPFLDKWRSFGFETRDVDGHDLAALRHVLEHRPAGGVKPAAVICHTVKGKGCASLEKYPPSHHENKISDDFMALLFKELENN